VATHPQAMLRNNLLMGIATPAGRLTLLNRTLTQRTADRIHQSTLRTRADFGRVLADDFRLGVDPSELDAVMAIVERHDGEATSAPALTTPRAAVGPTGPAPAPHA